MTLASPTITELRTAKAILTSRRQVEEALPLPRKGLIEALKLAESQFATKIAALAGSLENLTVEEKIYDYLCRKYVQKGDIRQRADGLSYMKAETHDLAREIASWIETNYETKET